MTKENLKQIIEYLSSLNEEADAGESILTMRGGRGYAPGHPYPRKMEKPGYGDLDPYHTRKKQKISQTGPVEVSRVYRKEEPNV